MDKHEIVVKDIRHVEQAMEFTGKALTEGEILKTNTTDNSPRHFYCSCGEAEMSYQKAVEHMKEVNGDVSPETFQEVARKIKRGEQVALGTRSNGFVYEGQVPQTDYSGNPLRKGYVVGYHTGDDLYVVGLMHKKSETVGRNDPKLQVRENEYVKIALYEVELPYDSGAPKNIAKYAIEHGDHVDDGYINGYRLTRLSDVLDDLFKWYSA
jgi:hypothetical protein